MDTLHGYHILREFSTENAGLSRWSFGEKEGRQFFIKEFLTPVYPDNLAELSPETVERKKKICMDFYAEKSIFYRELGKCRTGNNVIVQDFFREGSHYYIVTEKVDAVSTDPQFVSQLGDEQKMTIIRAVLYSVSALHGAGIVHADLKADNILIKETEDGFYTAKIIDFDAGFFSGHNPSEVQGDFVYMAPETFLAMQGNDMPLTEKIDIFALGILFHQYWTGELPKFKAVYQYAFEAMLYQSKLILSPCIPDSLQTVLMLMLERRPMDRIEAVNALRMLNENAAEVDSSPQRQSRLKKSKGFYRPQDIN